LLTIAAAAAAAPASAVEVFVAIDPCRIFDTRPDQDLDGVPGDPLDNDAPGLPNDPGVDEPRAITIQGNPRCPDVPASGVTAIAATVLVVNMQTRGFLTVFPQDGGFQGTSVLNFPFWAGDVANPVDAEFASDNGTVLPLDSDPSDGDLAATWEATKNPPDNPNPTIDLVIDVTGYFVEVQAAAPVTLTGEGPVVLGLDPAFQLPGSCANGDVAAWDGDSWECAEVGDVTDVFAGTGLQVQNSGGPQPTLSLDPAFTLPSDCETDDVPSWDGDSWECTSLTGGGSGAVVVSHAARHNQLNTSAGQVTYGPAGASNPTDVQTTTPAAQRIEILSPEAGCVAQNMRVRQVHPTTAAAVPMGAGQERIFRLLVNGVENVGDLTCTIPDGDSTCLSPGTATIAPEGQRLSIQATNVGSGSFPTADGLITWECVVAP
jgi:hypothetical protein